MGDPVSSPALPPSARQLAYILVTCEPGAEDDLPKTAPKDIIDLFGNKQFTDSLQFGGVTSLPFSNKSVKRYTRFHLRSALKFMGCKGADSNKIADRAFREFERVYALRQKGDPTRSPLIASTTPPPSRAISSNFPNVNTNNTRKANTTITTTTTITANNNSSTNNNNNNNASCNPPNNSNSNNTYHTYTNNSEDPLSVTITRNNFYMIVMRALQVNDYDLPHHMVDFPIACAAQDRKHSFTILLGGTSGCGKSTLAALLATRIGFSAVISTDNIRQLMRKFISKEEAPILWSSTYHAGEFLDGDSSLTPKERILKGYEAQNEMIFKELDALIGTYEERNESLIIEGVHLDTRLIMRLVKKHRTCVPFLMYISNEAKHRERFAIRAKYMTIDPKHNKYTKYFKNIRIINDQLCEGADEKMIPQIDNTNMDRSLATIHSTIFNCLKRHVLNGESYYDAKEDKMIVVHEEFEAIKHTLWSSKGMLRVIRARHIRKESESSAALTEGAAEEKGEEEEEDDEDEPPPKADLTTAPGDESNFNSDEETEDHKPIKSQQTPKITKLAQVYNDDEGESSDDDDTRSEYFMDCGSLGS